MVRTGGEVAWRGGYGTRSGLRELWAGGGAHGIMAVDGRGAGTLAVDLRWGMVGGWKGREEWGLWWSASNVTCDGSG